MWRHNGRDGVSDHQSHDCLLNRLFRRKSKKHQSSASLAFVWRIHRWPLNSPHKWPVMRKMFPFDDTSWYPYDATFIVLSTRWLLVAQGSPSERGHLKSWYEECINVSVCVCVTKGHSTDVCVYAQWFMISFYRDTELCLCVFSWCQQGVWLC